MKVAVSYPEKKKLKLYIFSIFQLQNIKTQQREEEVDEKKVSIFDNS
jgi:hypothetical protein